MFNLQRFAFALFYSTVLIASQVNGETALHPAILLGL